MTNQIKQPLDGNVTSGRNGPRLKDTLNPEGSPSARRSHRPYIAIGLLLAGFLIIESFIPLRTAVQIGADEGFELAKATLCLKGHHLYTEVWNDQPPLLTFLVTQILRYVSPSILGPRLLTIAFSLLLLTTVFFMVLRINGLATATLATGLVIASPGFLELSSSCMLEVPALATASAAICLLTVDRDNKGLLWEILSGAVFGLALQIKLVPAIYLSLAALIIYLRHRQDANVRRGSIAGLAIFGVSLTCAYLGSDLLIERGVYLSHFQQSWSSHFAPAQTSEYGSTNDHPFQWIVLLKNWDVAVPALVGLVVILRKSLPLSLSVLPLAWVALTFAVFGIHKPWWAYYYVHTAIPLCWCASVGIDFLYQKVKLRRGLLAVIGLCCLCMCFWMGARIYLQVMNLRLSPRIFSSPVIAQMERFKPFAEWIFADKLIYSFHSGIPMVPSLAVVPIKRMWSGQLTNLRMMEELKRYKPSLILLLNDGREVPFKDMLQAEYQLVYMDKDNRLYANKAIAKKPTANRAIESSRAAAR